LNTFLALCLYNFMVFVIQFYSAIETGSKWILLAYSKPFNPSYLPNVLTFFK